MFLHFDFLEKKQKPLPYFSLADPDSIGGGGGGKLVNKWGRGEGCKRKMLKAPQKLTALGVLYFSEERGGGFPPWIRYCS